VDHHPNPNAKRHVQTAFVITLFLFVDGFDLFLIGKIAPAIAEGFGRRPIEMDVVFTWHQIGLAVGAFVVPALADRFGSKRALIAMAALFGLGNIASAFVTDFVAFALLRGACGFCMAGAMPVGLSLLSENVPKEKLGFMLSIAMVGMSVGAAANSVVPAWLLDPFGWQSGFVLGGVLPLLLLPVLMFGLSESSRFVADAGQSTRNSLASRIAPLFASGRWSMTLLLWAVVFLSMGQTALIAVWLPTFFLELGHVRIQDFAVVASLTAIGGGLGTLAAGWLQDRFGPFLVTGLGLAATGAALVLLGLIPFHSPLFAVCFFVMSLFQSVGIAGINLLLVRLYPVEVRATGAGWAAGMGRIGGALAPATGTLILGSQIGLAAAMGWIALPLFLLSWIVLPVLAWSQVARRKDARGAVAEPA
jgi:AAHS family 4-hydroxybenzoate transporter-like MFS transporter